MCALNDKNIDYVTKAFKDVIVNHAEVNGTRQIALRGIMDCFLCLRILKTKIMINIPLYFGNKYSRGVFSGKKIIIQKVVLKKENFV